MKKIIDCTLIKDESMLNDTLTFLKETFNEQGYNNLFVGLFKKHPKRELYDSSSDEIKLLIDKNPIMLYCEYEEETLSLSIDNQNDDELNLLAKLQLTEFLVDFIDKNGGIMPSFNQ